MLQYLDRLINLSSAHLSSALMLDGLELQCSICAHMGLVPFAACTSQVQFGTLRHMAFQTSTGDLYVAGIDDGCIFRISGRLASPASQQQS
jgi:hypothetical protein